MDPHSSTYITHSTSFHFLFHSFLPTLNPIVVSIFFSVASFPADQRPGSPAKKPGCGLQALRVPRLRPERLRPGPKGRCADVGLRV